MLFRKGGVYIVICQFGWWNDVEDADCELARENNSFAAGKDGDPELVSRFVRGVAFDSGLRDFGRAAPNFTLVLAQGLPSHKCRQCF